MATAKLEFTILQQTEHAYRYEDEENGREVLHGAPAEVLNACEWRPLDDQCVEWVTNHAKQDAMTKVVLLRHLVAMKILPQHSVPDRWMTDVWHRVADWLVAGSTIWKSQCKDKLHENYGRLLIIRPVACLALHLELDVFKNKDAHFPFHVGGYGRLRLNRAPASESSDVLMKLIVRRRGPFNILATMRLASGEEFAKVVCHRFDYLYDVLAQSLQYKKMSYHRPVVLTCGETYYKFFAARPEILAITMWDLWAQRFGCTRRIAVERKRWMTAKGAFARRVHRKCKNVKAIAK